MLRTVLAAFDELLTRVALTPDQAAVGSTRQTNLREFLATRFALYAEELSPNPWLIGSYSRDTILRQERDIDIMVSLSPAKYWDTYRSDSSALVYLVRNALNKEYAKSDVTSSGAAVVMEMSVFNVDVVPVMPRDGGGYLVANGQNGWKATNPNVHFALLRDHNKQDNRLKPLVKLMKYWNLCNDGLLESFHLEMMVEQMWRDVSIGSYPHGVKETLRVLTTSIANSYNDPWASGGRIDGYLTTDNRNKVLDHARKDAASSATAETLRNEGEDQSAFDYWQAVFRHQFPAYG